MAWYTTRYQNGQLVADRGMVAIGHTRGYPRFKLNCELAANITELAPTRSQGDWIKNYRALLDSAGVDSIRALIEGVAEGRDCALMCYEHVGIEGEDSCHRRVFAEWWEEQTGEVVEELPDEGSINDRLKTMLLQQTKAEQEERQQRLL